MRPYGSDRAEASADGLVRLDSRLPKEGWCGTIEKTLTSSEHPGTAIVWDGECFEVVTVEALAEGVRYTLRPWRDDQTMRLTQTYDAATERQRLEAHRDQRRRTQHRRGANLLAMFTGQLPGDVQQRLANEVGTNAPLLTIVSAAPEYAAAAAITLWMADARVNQAAGPPLWLLFLGGYFALDATIRAGVAWTQSRPLGSLHGLVAYAVFWTLHPRRKELVAPMTVESTPRLAPIAVESTAHDRVTMLEPILTLLSPEDQALLARRYAFEYRHLATPTAAVILVFALLGVFTSSRTLAATPRVSAVLSLLVAGALSVEQSLRLVALRRRPAASVLRFLVRPLARTLLE